MIMLLTACAESQHGYDSEGTFTGSTLGCEEGATEGDAPELEFHFFTDWVLTYVSIEVVDAEVPWRRFLEEEEPYRWVGRWPAPYGEDCLSLVGSRWLYQTNDPDVDYTFVAR